MAKAIRTAVVGATGYGGAELVRLLSLHPEAEVVVATSERLAGTRLSDDCPWLASDLVLQSFDPESLNVDFVFLAQEAGFAMLHAPKLLARAKVVDLSADFRLLDKAVYEATYKRAWDSPGLATSRFTVSRRSLTELIRNARLVANPGCHATNTILGLQPLVVSNLLDGIPVVDSKSGVSGAGRSRKETDYLFAEMTGNFKAYAVTGHRHIPEIEQQIGVKIRFTPHLVPESRGIFTTIHAPLKAGTTLEAIKAIYQGSTFVRIVDQIPSTKQVLGSNRVDINVSFDDHTGFAVVTVVQDNLVKGAAGQAIQNMNLMAGLPEETGLPMHGVWP